MGLAPLPPGYILSSSDTTLESLELSRLNAVSNLRKELHQVVEEWIEAEVQARVARLMRHSASIEHLALNGETPAAATNFPQGNAKSVGSLPAAARSDREVTKLEQCETPAEMFGLSRFSSELENAPEDKLGCTRSLSRPLLEHQIPLKREPETALRSLASSTHSRLKCTDSPNADRVPARRLRKPLTGALKQKRSPPSHFASLLCSLF